MSYSEAKQGLPPEVLFDSLPNEGTLDEFCTILDQEIPRYSREEFPYRTRFYIPHEEGSKLLQGPEILVAQRVIDEDGQIYTRVGSLSEWYDWKTGKDEGTRAVLLTDLEVRKSQFMIQKEAEAPDSPTIRWSNLE